MRVDRKFINITKPFVIVKCVIMTLICSLTVSQYCVNGFHVGLTPCYYAVRSAYTTKKSGFL